MAKTQRGGQCMASVRPVRQEDPPKQTPFSPAHYSCQHDSIVKLSNSIDHFKHATVAPQVALFFRSPRLLTATPPLRPTRNDHHIPPLPSLLPSPLPSHHMPLVPPPTVMSSTTTCVPCTIQPSGKQSKEHLHTLVQRTVKWKCSHRSSGPSRLPP